MSIFPLLKRNVSTKDFVCAKHFSIRRKDVWNKYQKGKGYKDIVTKIKLLSQHYGLGTVISLGIASPFQKFYKQKAVSQIKEVPWKIMEIGML